VAPFRSQRTAPGALFIGDPSRNRIDPAAKQLELSPVFDWFRSDFEARRVAACLPGAVP
jgi:hypothetical protein